jgi:hypothetical protein
MKLNPQDLEKSNGACLLWANSGHRSTVNRKTASAAVLAKSDQVSKSSRPHRARHGERPISSKSIIAPGTEFFRPETGSQIRRIPPAGDPTAKTTRRICRANAGFSRKVSGIRDWGNCVVADAVRVEPVSTPKFPANRENNREFRRIRLLGPILKADTRANSAACSEIPYATEQGIISAEQRILAQEQGIFPVKSKIIIARLDRHFGRPGRASRT